jgi:hypothetical protein
MKPKVAFLLLLSTIFIFGCALNAKHGGRLCFGGPNQCQDPEIEVKVVK